MRKVLVFRHGIVINRYFMLPMERYFLRRGYEVHNRTYPTTRKVIEEHARDLSEDLMALHRDLEARGEPHELYVITHSMGGLVLRYALTHFAMPPLRRAVMLVPPNRGSATGRFFRGFFLYRWIFGTKAGSQLAADPPGIFEAAGVPEGVEIGIIAGRVPYKLWPARLDKPHDGVVSVSEAALPPFPLKVIPYGHTPILFVRSAWEEAEHFLEHGRFPEAGARETAVPEAAAPEAGARVEWKGPFPRDPMVRMSCCLAVTRSALGARLAAPRSALGARLALAALLAALLAAILSAFTEHPETVARAPGNELAETRTLLQALRPEVDAFARGLSAGADPDGMPLLRKEGKLYYWDFDEKLPEDGISWIPDAWGRPIVLVRSEDDPADWCLISAGADGRWTSEGVLGQAAGGTSGDTSNDTYPEEFSRHSPHYYGSEESLHRRVLGDDVVLNATGLFHQPYPFVPPKAGDALACLLRRVEDGSMPSGRGTGEDVLLSPDLEEELRDLAKEEREVLLAFLKKHEPGFYLCEDSWSHECPRKDGLLPYLFLGHRELYSSDSPPLWIQPEEDGWMLDWSVDELLQDADPQGAAEAVEEETEEPDKAEPAPHDK